MSSHAYVNRKFKRTCTQKKFPRYIFSHEMISTKYANVSHTDGNYKKEQMQNISTVVMY